MMARFLSRHGSGWRATRFYPIVTLASLSYRDSMVSGRRSACAGPGPDRTSRSQERG
ncbi:hypothetical protein Hanom_Chr16g01470201 [Helianthus anomalus]